MTLLNAITWTVDPALFTIMGKEIRWYGLFFAIAFFLGLVLTGKAFKDEKVPEAWTDKLFVYIIIATAVGARLGHCLFYGWEYYSQHPLDILKIWEGGLASHGGAIGIIIAIWIYSRHVTKRAMCWTFDRISFSVALAGCFIRLGNLMNHEIYGIATDLPWGFRFITNWYAVKHLGAEAVFSAPSHPTQIYEALCYLITFVVLYLLYRKTNIKHREGFLFGLLLAMLFIPRFFIEFIKNDQEAFEANMVLNMGQYLSIPFVLIGIFFIVRAFKRPLVYYDEKPGSHHSTPKKDGKDFLSNVKSGNHK